MKKSFILLSASMLISGVSFADQGDYCAPTALAGGKAIAKINNPHVTKKDLKNASVAVLNPEEGTKFEVRVGTMTFEVTTVALDGDCFIGNILKSE
ncbi:MAG: hypothetical protein ACXVCY_07390 [Pseudobdellovibrionaceae bacterium]